MVLRRKIFRGLLVTVGSLTVVGPPVDAVGLPVTVGPQTAVSSPIVVGPQVAAAGLPVTVGSPIAAGSPVTAVRLPVTEVVGSPVAVDPPGAAVGSPVAAVGSPVAVGSPTIVLRRAGYLAKFLRKISTLAYVWYINKYPEKMCSSLETMKQNSYPVSRVKHTTINTLRTKRQMILPQSFCGDSSCGQTRHRVEVDFFGQVPCNRG